MTAADINNDSKRCFGCGAALQSGDTAKPGFVPASALKAETAICKRCFRIRHYNEISTVTVDQNAFVQLLSSIADTDSLVVAIADIFDFEGSLISGLHRFIGRNPVLLVANKMDLLPKGLNWNRILNWVQQQAKAQGLKVEGVALCSAKRNVGFERVVERIDQLRKGRDVYVVGATNVGKSTLINRLIRDYSDMDAELTTSPIPGTTLDAVRIPLEDGKAVIDTPGIVYPHRLTEVVPKRVLSKLMPDKPVKPLVYQLQEKQTLFFGALARFDFVQGEPQSFTCYVSNSIKVHRTKLEKADALYAEHKGGLLSPPDSEEWNELPPLARHRLFIPKGKKADVYVSGLGWIAVNGESGAELSLHLPEGVKYAVRDRLI
ncbi:ribosome biogenesis GTPase YqeH [Xylanibacillus composti]|uniref:Ribosome biogenesis GTPase YqeH n=1 Tax=Xylanibacillus composti TaxID=1572762 RepID=A0A8J4H740_9BACL|nr:ribosome biogenesis GTPase YqeH [Xylanibacillus composti]MDT9724476.1 ribosome biogenesis GTPase YqeH [Xylanibacillus composti]GIQ69738.1 ribosome biogenesis GTPase YqeH [Xylanibacillus composti]